MSKNQSCVNTCEHYEERSRHGARAHKREGTEVCKQCAAAAAAAGRISRHGFDPWVEATGAPTWPVEPLREYVASLHDFNWQLMPEWLQRRLYRDENMTDRVADQCATWFGVPPQSVWLDWNEPVNTSDPTLDSVLASINPALFEAAAAA